VTPRSERRVIGGRLRARPRRGLRRQGTLQRRDGRISSTVTSDLRRSSPPCSRGSSSGPARSLGRPCATSRPRARPGRPRRSDQRTSACHRPTAAPWSRGAACHGNRHARHRLALGGSSGEAVGPHLAREPYSPGEPRLARETAEDRSGSFAVSPRNDLSAALRSRASRGHGP
jgi:hypothetical protein